MGHPVQYIPTILAIFCCYGIAVVEIFLRKHYAVLMVFVVESSFVTHLFQQFGNDNSRMKLWLLPMQLSKINKNQDILLGKLAKNEIIMTGNPLQAAQ